MKLSPDEDASPVSWLSLAEGTPVVSADGEQVGTVAGVEGDYNADIFHGLIVRDAVQRHDVSVRASDIYRMTTEAVEISLTSDVFRELIPGSNTQ